MPCFPGDLESKETIGQVGLNNANKKNMGKKNPNEGRLLDMKKYFITGLAILLPLTVTVAIIIFLVNFLTKPFLGFVTKIFYHTQLKDVSFLFLTSEQVIYYISKILIIISILLITLLLGYVARWFFFKSLLSLSDRILHKIPIVNKVYKTTQDIIKTIFVTDKNSFKQVVLVPFPNENVYSIGLVSRAAPQACRDVKNPDMVTVFVPTAPNPTTGFLLIFNTKDLIYLDMKTEDAVKYVVSCGVITPSGHKKETSDKGDVE